jgi:CheY-like chemotaxis protein/Tfp pilus assembly protein PilZ
LNRPARDGTHFNVKLSKSLDGFHTAFTIHPDRIDRLEAGFTGLERLERISLVSAPGESTAVALLAFADSGAASNCRPTLRQVAEQLGATLLHLGEMDAAALLRLQDLVARIEARGSRQTTRSGATGPPALCLVYADLEALFAAWAKMVADGALWIPTSRPPVGDLYQLMLTVGERQLVGGTGRVSSGRPPPRGEAGFWIEPAASPELKELLSRRSGERRAGRPLEAPPGIVRRDPRYQTMLEVRFDDMPALAAQWAADISHGGMFVCCRNPPDLRTKVEVHIKVPSGEEIAVGAEVVHRILSGHRPGVGVQFIDRDPDVLAPLVALMEEYRRRQPRVLVVDDEAIWRSTLVRALGALGCEVRLAADGKEGLLKLIDGYFDLDLVILDLHMPNLDGRGLIERIRQHGGDSTLKVFLFSAAPPEELAALEALGLATGVFSKLERIDALTARIARELGLPPPGMPAAHAA